MKFESAFSDRIHVASGSGKAVLDFSGFPINGTFEVKSFYHSGTIVAPFEFKEEHVEKSYGPDILTSRTQIGNADAKNHNVHGWW